MIVKEIDNLDLIINMVGGSIDDISSCEEDFKKFEKDFNNTCGLKIKK